MPIPNSNFQTVPGFFDPIPGQVLAASGVGGKAGSYGLRNVGTRCAPPTAVAAQPKAFSRCKQYATQQLTALGVLLSAWKTNGTSQTEDNIGSDITWTASVEYPIGTLTQITFNGATSGVSTNGNDLVSDIVKLPVPIPAGAAYFIRTFQAGSNIAYHSYLGLADVAGSVPLSGEVMTFGVGATDLTMSATVPNHQQGNINFRPTAVLAYSYQVSIFGAGDSRAALTAYESATDGLGAQGQIERPINGRLPCINVAIQGERVELALSNYTKRLRLAQYCTTVFSAYGINDLNLPSPPRTAVQILGYLTSFKALLGLPFYQATLYPNVSTTNGYIDLAGQTVGSTNTERINFNKSVRAGSAPLDGFFDIAKSVESSQDSGLLQVPDRVVSDAAMTVGQATLTSATANFSPSDVGKLVAVTGSGIAGLPGISTYISRTSVTLSATAVNTVSAAVAGIGVIVNSDGLHLSSSGGARVQASATLPAGLL